MSDTGRHYVTVKGRTFCIEPIDNTKGKGRKGWGDYNPATGKVEGSFGNKSVGAIHESESIITEKNGFKNIITLEPGTSPMGYIESIVGSKK